MGKVLGIVYRAIATHLSNKAGYTRARAQAGAVTLIQCFGGALNANIHFHMLFLDGVYIDSTAMYFSVNETVTVPDTSRNAPFWIDVVLPDKTSVDLTMREALRSVWTMHYFLSICFHCIYFVSRVSPSAPLISYI